MASTRSPARPPLRPPLRPSPRPSRAGAGALAGALACALACPAKPAPTAPEPAACPEPPPAIADSSEGAAPLTEAAVHAAWIRAHYDKREVQIPMRDGVRLFTAIYTPKESAAPPPILMTRTPYSVAPYGDEYKDKLGPSAVLARDGYIFVYQDVRGTMMSEGEFVDMTPHRPNKADKAAIDESTDTYDTIEWLLANVAGHNGRVGTWGVSYPGFYAAAGMIDAHPALRAVSPQAPIADWYFDDFFHHGAFFLPHFFNFFVNFGAPRPTPTKDRGARFQHGTRDGFAFFLDLGALTHVDDYFKGQIAFWREVIAHPNYDDFWRARALPPHLQRVAPAVMVVGGWFDAEDLYGPLTIYRAIERQNPEVDNVLVMGPWQHGGWARTDGDHLGGVAFGAATSKHYQEEIERRFFDHYLRGDPKADGARPLAEATVFETGRNQWRTFPAWPPPGTEPHTLYLADHGALALDRAPTGKGGVDRFVSDPARPVPFTSDVAIGMTREYMTDDQRFAARRPDVLAYETEPLTEAMTIAGPLVARLQVATTAQDADWVVKLIDVFPGDAEDHPFTGAGRSMSGYQMMVRSEVFRGRYRQSYERPRPFTPGKVEEVAVPLQDVLHTFEPGHRIMIQIQSTWFPLVDRNPQRWVANIFTAKDEDFVAATHSVHRTPKQATRIELAVLPAAAAK